MSFNKQIKNFNNKTQRAANAVFRGTALSLFGKIVKRTPVGNPSTWKGKAPKGYTGGRLRANWQVQINTPADGEIDRQDKNGGSTINNGHANMARAEIGDSIFITNNLPYADAIENGRSGQAPSGMVKVTIAESQHIVATKAKQERKRVYLLI